MFYELMMLCHMSSCDPGEAYGLVFDDKAVCESVKGALQPPEAMRTWTYEWVCSEQHFRPGEKRATRSRQ